MGFQGRHDSEGLSDINQTGAIDHGVSRDDRGRFVGCGNPAGRPRKVKLPSPNSLSAALAVGLQNDITIRVDGKPKTVPVFEAIATKLMHAMMSGGTRDTLVILRQLEKLGALDVLNSVQDYKDSLMEANSPSCWSPELEAKYRILIEDYIDIDDGPEDTSGSEDDAGRASDNSNLNADGFDVRS
jgi:hypothetical protein